MKSKARAFLTIGIFFASASLAPLFAHANQVYIYSSQFGTVGSGNGQFNAISAIAISTSTGNIYVADFNNNRIEKFNSSGNYLSQFGSAGSGNGQFSHPEGIALDSSDNVYVTDSQNNRVEKFSSSGTYISQWGSLGAGNGQFNLPYGIAVDASGNVYVADGHQGSYPPRIQKFDSNGTYLSQFGSSGSGNGQFQGVFSIAISTSTSNIYAVDTSGSGRVEKFDLSGNYISQFSNSASGSDQGQITGISADSLGNVYVTQFDGLLKFDSSGNFITEFGSRGSGNGQFLNIGPSAIDSTGNVYVIDSNHNRVEKFILSPIPVLTTQAASPVSHTAATFNGTLVYSGAVGTTTSHGFVYGTTTLYGATTTQTGSFSSGSFTAALSNPVPGTTYHYAAYATNATGTGYGPDSTFTIPTVFISSQNGNWNDGATWGNASPGAAGTDYPAPSDDAVITTAVALTQNQSIHNLTINSGGTLTLGNHTLGVSGNITNNGTLTANTSTVILTGTNQTIQGATTFYNLAKTTSATDTLSFDGSATTTITNNLTLTGLSTGLLSIKRGTLAKPTFNVKWGGSNGTDNGQLSGPVSLAIDSLGNIYVTDRYLNTITKFNSSGTYVSRFGSSGSGNGQFNDLQYVAISTTTGDIYAVDTGNNRVEEFDPSGNYLSQFGSLGAGNGQFNHSQDITIDSSGNLYITSFKRIQKFSPAGTYISGFGTEGSGNGEIETPDFIAISTSTGNIYVTDDFSSNERILIFDSSGNYLSQFGSSGSGNGQFEDPLGITFDTKGNFYVVDPSYGDVQKFDSNGNYISRFGNNNAYGGQFASPDGISQDSSGNIFVADPSNARIQKFDSSRNFLFALGFGVIDGANQLEKCTVATQCQTGIYGSDPGEFGNPQDVAVDSQGNIYVADLDNGEIIKFDSSGNYLTEWPAANPGGIALDTSNNIYVVDQGDNQVVKFDSSGNLITTWGTTGSGNGELSYPADLAVATSTGNVYVADQGNFRVEEFDSSGNYISQFGTEGSAEGEFECPQAISIDPFGNVYITDVCNNNVSVFDSAGNFLYVFGEGVQDGALMPEICTANCQAGNYGSDDGEFANSYGISASASGVIVSNLDTNYIDSYTFSPIFVLSPQASVSASYLSVSNSDNIGSTIACSNCIDLGGNTGWSFVTPPPAAPTVTSPASNSSGSISSGGGSSSYSALSALLAPSTTTTAYLDSLNIQSVATTTSATASSVTSVATFSRTLAVGSTGTDVISLQNLLTTFGFYHGPVTGYFGSLTEAAVENYQRSKGIDPVGSVGPITRTSLNVAENTLQVSSSPLITTSVSPTTEFTRNLTLGSNGIDVRSLQEYLNSHGFSIASSGAGSAGHESTYFGNLTAAALADFQKSYGIIPAVGYFGPITRAFVISHP